MMTSAFVYKYHNIKYLVKILCCRFVEIQQAYEKLSDIKHRRMSRNKRSDDGGAADQPFSV